MADDRARQRQERQDADRIRELQESVTNLNNQLNNLVQLVQPVLQNLAVPGQAPAPATFATTPGTNKVTDLIDYATRYGASLYEEGAKGLYDSTEEKFDLDNLKAVSFQREVKARVEKMGWNNPDQGITTYLVDGSTFDLIEDYGRISMQEIQSQSEPFYLNGGAKSQSRAAQNNAMMTQMLLKSLTQGAKDQVAVYKDEYELSNGAANNPQIVQVAPALYKVIMRLTTLDTKITTKALRDTILDIPAYCSAVNGDIDKVHTLFNNTYAQLKARGEDVNDKEGILFDAYSHVPDGQFRAYIRQKKTDYYHDTNDMRGTNWTDIMKKAKEEFDNLKQDQHHTWGSAEDEAGLVALKAEIKQELIQSIKDKNLQLSRDLRKKLDEQLNKTGTQAGQTQQQQTQQQSQQQTQTGSGNTTRRNRKNRNNRRRQTADEAWKKVGPKQGEPKTKQKDNKTWHWCTHHQAWCIHKEDECRIGLGLVANQAEANSQETPTSETSINASYAAMLAQIAAVSE